MLNVSALALEANRLFTVEFSVAVITTNYFYCCPASSRVNLPEENPAFQSAGVASANAISFAVKGLPSGLSVVIQSHSYKG